LIAQNSLDFLVFKTCVISVALLLAGHGANLYSHQSHDSSSNKTLSLYKSVTLQWLGIQGEFRVAPLLLILLLTPPNKHWQCSLVSLSHDFSDTSCVVTMPYRLMKQSMEPPPPPPDCPPPKQGRRSRRSRSDRSSNAQQQTTTDAKTQQQQHDSPAVSASARTVTHENTVHTTEEQKTAFYAMEMEEALPTPDVRVSRFPRMHLPWSKHPLDPTAGDGIMTGISSGGSSVEGLEGLYYGDVMTSFPLEEDDAIHPNYSTESMAGSHASRFQRFRRSIAASLRSSFSIKSTQSQIESDDDNDSLNNFQDWTPPDSAYGAAFPICGWVPKHYRRLIEATIFALLAFVLVFFVVTTSIRLTLEDNKSDVSSSENNSGASSNKFSDDDYYIDYDNYNYNNNADDVVVWDDGAVVADDDAVAVNDDAADDELDDDKAAADDDGRMFLRLF